MLLVLAAATSLSLHSTIDNTALLTVVFAVAFKSCQ